LDEEVDVDVDVEGIVPGKILIFAKYTKPTFMPDEDPSCDPWVYEAIIVSGLARPLANTLLLTIHS
jgi:hypothetical protein